MFQASLLFNAIINLVHQKNVPKNQHFLPPDMHTYVNVSMVKKCWFLGQFCVLTKWMISCCRGKFLFHPFQSSLSSLSSRKISENLCFYVISAIEKETTLNGSNYMSHLIHFNYHTHMLYKYFEISIHIGKSKGQLLITIWTKFLKCIIYTKLPWFYFMRWKLIWSRSSIFFLLMNFYGILGKCSFPV